MKALLRKLLLFSMIVVLASACAPTQYWIPPSAAPAAPELLAYASGSGAVSLINPGEASAPNQPTEPTPAIAIETLAIPEATQEALAPAEEPTSTPEAANALAPSPPPQLTPDESGPILYYTQAADTLPVVATRFGVKPSEITSADPIPTSAYLTPGQLLIIPRVLKNSTSSQQLLPDSEVVYSPSAADFDINAYVQQAGGKLSTYQQWLKSTGILTGAQVIKRVAIENSINPRLLLSLLEYQSNWVYGNPDDATLNTFPMRHEDPYMKYLYQQLVWAVNQLSIGYYAYREGRMTEIPFPDGSSARLAPDLNAGTAALQYYFAQQYQGQAWEQAIDPQNGFLALYTRMFGDPWERAAGVEPLFPPGLRQPPLTLPFTRGWKWSYTGGPHGAWEHDGAYAALDFAPGSIRPGCEQSLAWATASASGLVVRSDNGVVVIDLDGDGREQTGWVLVYLHLADDGRIPVGEWVDEGTPLGHPSCEGGFSTGTHLHIARKFNGEWIPADGPLPFNLGGWIAHAGDGPYKGTLTRDNVTLTACTCSNAQTFITRTENDP